MGTPSWGATGPKPLVMGLLLVLTLGSVGRAAAGPTKWTVLVYMLADNNLEPYGLLDLEELMAAMADERGGTCTTTACDGSCPPDKAETYRTAAGCAADKFARRCCSPGSYPDVLVMVDKGGGSALPYRAYGNYPKMQTADYILLEGYWTNVKTVKALPGGQWELLTEVDELDLASTGPMADFLKEGFRRFPPAADRKYMVVYWDHGQGWLGYGADGRCSSTGSYEDHSYCSVASLATLEAGIQQGLAGVVNPVTGQPLKIDVLGFDACLMSMYEIGSVLAPYANYLLASELLEPGTGWDYSSLGYLVTGQLWSGEYVDPAKGHTEVELADLLISSFMNSRASGLTLALTDLRLLDTSVAGGLDGALNNLAAELSKVMADTPAYGMQLLQQRTLLGSIQGAEDNVDLGALLIRLKSVTPAGTLKDKISAALTAYRSSIVSFQHDQILPDGTGMAIYFPPNRYSMDNDYLPFVNADPAALSAWFSFLDGLYKAIVAVGNDQNLQELKFLESYAVPYWAVDSHTWITHGTLTTLAGLTADLMYGFISPTGSDFIVAGTTVGRIAQYAVVGAWSGQLWGLVQDLTPGDGAVDGLALAYADEQRLTDADGNVQTLVLQMQVFYAKSCYVSASEMTSSMLKYTLNVTGQMGDYTLQLYTSTGTKAWGEVSPSSGGVIIPYLSAIDLTGTRTGRVPSFGYSDCLKWGYEDSIKVATFNATQAVGILGLDLTRDLATMLTVTGLSGRVKALYGTFEPAQKTQGGCQCAQLWSYKDSLDKTIYVRGQCVNPGGAHARAWCQYEPESCTGTPTPMDGKELTDFCAPVMTLSGCECHANWRLDGTSYYGSCANTGDPLGSWCVVDKTTCPSSYRAHGYGAKTVTASVVGVAANLTGQDFDYCQVNTINKCRCSNTWEYGGQSYGGTCRTGLLSSTAAPGISPDTNWCFIDKQCPAAKHIDGYAYDLCTSEGGRVTEAGDACQFPATYHGVPLYDCISYNHSTPGVETPKPWCFTNAAAGNWGYCSPWTCTAALKANCPAGPPDVSNLVAGGWDSLACLETLCNARADLANVSLCMQDTQEDQTLLSNLYATLAGSSAFGQLLSSTHAADSLDSYCNKNFGYQCMDTILDPECPGLFRQNNVWMASTNKATLCDLRCLKALCRLQEQAKTAVTGTPGISGTDVQNITCADGELTTSIMWSLMRIIDRACDFPGPINLACNKLMSPPQLCTPNTQLVSASGNISDGTLAGGKYGANTECSWTISMPEQPFIDINFSRLSTERLYDVVTVEDFDGLIGRFSGSEVPSTLSTDTGLLRVNFTADGSLQEKGFAAAYLASSTPQVYIPTCTDGAKLVQVVLRTRAYGSEVSWVVSRRSLVNLVVEPTPTEHNIVMAGGQLPPRVRTKVPPAVAAQAQMDYKDYRSYYSYACLATGGYALFSFDSYGDGWEGGRITLTQVVNATTGCVLLSGASPLIFNLTTKFSVTADADTSSAACSALTSPDSPYFYVEAGLVVLAEDSRTFNLAKQRKLKEGIASLLDVDTAQVTIQSLANATGTELTTARANMTGESRAIASRRAAAAAAAAASAGGSASGGSAVVPAAGAAAAGFGHQPATRRLQSPAEDEGASAAAGAGGSIHAMLQQQQLVGGAGSRHRVQELGRIAVGVQELVASGALDATQRQLDQAERWLQQQQRHDTDSQEPAATAAQPGSHSRAESEAAAAAAAVAAGEQVASLAYLAMEEAGEVASGASVARRLQQLLTLTDNGAWQDAGQLAPAEQTPPVDGPTEPDTNNTSSSSSAAVTDDLGSTGTATAGAGGLSGSSSSSSDNSTSAIDVDAAAAGSSSSNGDRIDASSTIDTNSSSDATAANSTSSGSRGAGVPAAVDNTTSSASTSAEGNDSADGSSSSSGPPVPLAVLAEKPLGPSAGSAPATGPVQSQLMLDLQAHQPNTPVQTTKRTDVASSSRSSKWAAAGGVPVVEVKLSPSEAFGGLSVRTAAARARAAASRAQTADGGGGGSSFAAAVAAVPKPVDGGVSADSSTGSPYELSLAPDSLPFRLRPAGAAEQQTGGGDGTPAVALFDALGPSRSLLQLPGGTESSQGLEPVLLPPGSSSGSGSSGGWHTGRDGGFASELAQIDPEVLGEVVAAGRQGPRGSDLRPQPPSGVFVVTQPGAEPCDSTNSSSSSSSSSTADGRRGPSDPQRQQHQLKRARKGGVRDADAIALPLSWPEQLLAAEAAEAASQQQQGGRQLLQAARNRGVTLVLRVNGYSNASAAAAAEAEFSSLVKNGTLQSRLASQGWPGVSLGLLYTTTGSVGSFWARRDLLALIVGVCVAGGVVAAGVFALWYIRRRRQAGASQMPPGGSAAGGGPRPALGVPTGGRVSYVPQQPPYMSPQQAAAAVVVPYLHLPYSRSGSPSAPMLLTTSQQSAFAASAIVAGAGPQGLSSQAPPIYSGYGSARPGGWASGGPGYAGAGQVGPAGSGGSWSGPIQQQQQQQQGQYMPIYPAPMPGQQVGTGMGRSSSPYGGVQGPTGAGSAPAAARSSAAGPYGVAAQPPAGYPIIAAPGGFQQQQQQHHWQQQQ